ncbi:MAG TPA: SulP family inorganic anion transporter, partial [Pedococcus sp.]|nr:SulP family inorganic anion transporter [Pedococcus sp.]
MTGIEVLAIYCGGAELRREDGLSWEVAMSVLTRIRPVSLRGYKPGWLSGDVIAGVTLAAIAIPECMGYTSISQTPVVTGLYSVIFPTMVFALLGSSRLLVVGADSATAAILAAGLASLGIAGL